jgi:ribonuclease HI
VKLNFDGASKGNLGPVGYGVVFRDDNGIILHILVGSLGNDTNNVVELWDLIKGIHTTTSLGFHKLIVEGDSYVVLSLLTCLINGSNPTKISPNWRLLSNLELLKSLLLNHIVLIPSHVRREANKVENKLANIGVNMEDSDLDCNSS